MGKETVQELTDKQVRFVEEYLVDFNATQAALRAGYSPKTASRIGPELLGKTCIARAVERRMKDAAKKCVLTRAELVRMNIEFYKINSNLVPKNNFDGEQAKNEKGELVWKMVDAAAAGKALDMLNRYKNLYEKDNKRELAGGLLFSWGVQE